MNASHVYIRVLRDNVASLGVARRVGAKLVGTAPSAGGATHLVFRIDLRAS